MFRNFPKIAELELNQLRARNFIEKLLRNRQKVRVEVASSNC